VKIKIGLLLVDMNLPNIFILNTHYYHRIMIVSNDDKQKALRIRRCVVEYFEMHNLKRVEAKELMPHFIKNEIFDTNNQDGLPIRNFLRKLERENYLDLIPQAQFEQKAINKNWYFIKV
jgi:hypothetical protein